MANKVTVAQVNERVDAMATDIAKLADAVSKLVAVQIAASEPTAKMPKAEPKKKERPWLTPCPEYATSAQRAQYDKLANEASKRRAEVVKVMGTEAVRCFIPVSSKDAQRMPHTVQWTATYK